MKLVLFFKPDGTHVWVNPEYIIAVEELSTERSTLFFDNNNSIRINGTAGQAAERLMQ